MSQLNSRLLLVKIVSSPVILSWLVLTPGCTKTGLVIGRYVSVSVNSRLADRLLVH